MAYIPRRIAEKLTIPVRGLKYRIYRWGDPAAEPVFLLHGWAGIGMFFQFLADFMPDHWCLIAPDLRGFGDTEWNQQGYWFPDYLADLDVIINTLAANKTVRLVGHSMGGNIVMQYAGIFPDLISHVSSLDQFGLEDSDPNMAGERYAQWIEEWRSSPTNSVYESSSSIVKMLHTLAPYLSDDKAEFLIPYWCESTDQGTVTRKIDPRHKRVNPVLYHREEAKACWRLVTAKIQSVIGGESNFVKEHIDKGLREDFKSCIRQYEENTIKSAGHMLHLDQPEELAQLLDKFLAS